MNLLQQRIEELGSAIINYRGNLVHIDAFYNSDRLLDYLGGLNCIQSVGLYDYEEIDYSRIKDNCLLIVKQDDKEVKRFRYAPIFKGTVKFSNPDKKSMTRVFTLRKCLYSKRYNMIILDENNEKLSIVYENMQDVESNFEKMFLNYKLYGLDNKIIKEGFDYVKRYDINRY
ncbi:MAG: hypothetical protein PHU78_09830 [Heliobacteriaceae bacterium]|nr:hypothetical protein [Heliobacteriaceae bacterium]